MNMLCSLFENICLKKQKAWADKWNKVKNFDWVVVQKKKSHKTKTIKRRRHRWWTADKIRQDEGWSETNKDTETGHRIYYVYFCFKL